MTNHLDSMCVGELAAVLYRQYQSYISKEMDSHNVSFAEFTVLAVIPINKAITQGCLAARLFCDNAMITRSLKTLAEKELISRQKCQSDKRAVLVSLTPQGVKMKDIGLKKRDIWKSHVMEGMTSEMESDLLIIFREMVQKALQQQDKQLGVV